MKSKTPSKLLTVLLAASVAVTIPVVSGCNYVLICRETTENGTVSLKKFRLYDPNFVNSISPVGKIYDHSNEICFPSGMDEMGSITKKLYNTLTGIQMGRIEDRFGWVCHQIISVFLTITNTPLTVPL